jgi:hypothetical protein
MPIRLDPNPPPGVLTPVIAVRGLPGFRPLVPLRAVRPGVGAQENLRIVGVRLAVRRAPRGRSRPRAPDVGEWDHVVYVDLGVPGLLTTFSVTSMVGTALPDEVGVLLPCSRPNLLHSTGQTRLTHIPSRSAKIACGATRTLRYHPPLPQPFTLSAAPDHAQSEPRSAGTHHEVRALQARHCCPSTV